MSFWIVLTLTLSSSLSWIAFTMSFVFTQVRFLNSSSITRNRRCCSLDFGIRDFLFAPLLPSLPDHHHRHGIEFTISEEGILNALSLLVAHLCKLHSGVGGHGRSTIENSGLFIQNQRIDLFIVN